MTVTHILLRRSTTQRLGQLRFSSITMIILHIDSQLCAVFYVIRNKILFYVHC